MNMHVCLCVIYICSRLHSVLFPVSQNRFVHVFKQARRQITGAYAYTRVRLHMCAYYVPCTPIRNRIVSFVSGKKANDRVYRYIYARAH